MNEMSHPGAERLVLSSLADAIRPDTYADPAFADGTVVTDEERAIAEPGNADVSDAQIEADFDADQRARWNEKAKALQKAEGQVHEPVVSSGDRGSRTFVLYKPIKVDGRMLTKVTLRPTTAGDLDDCASGDVPTARALLARLTGLHPAVIRGLDIVDLSTIYSSFWDMLPPWAREAMSDERV